MDIKELGDDLKSTFHEFKKLNDKMLGDVEELGKARSEDVEKLDRINNRLDEVETKMNRPAVSPSTSNVEPDEAKAHFNEWLRKGTVSPEASKTLLLSNDPAAGFLAPPSFVAELLKDVEELTPLRSMARVMQTSSTTVQVPRRTAPAEAEWVGEVSTRTPDTSLQFGLEEITTHESSCVYDVSQAMLEDSIFSLEQALQEEFSFAIAKAQGTAFTSGNGVTRPEGLMTAASVAEINSGDADVITADSLITAFYSLPDEYARASSWLMKRSTVAAIRKLKDTSAGNYLWAPGIGGEAPATILDRPYQESPDMPTEVADNYPVIFGDFRRCYLIVDRVGLTIQRDPFTQAASGKIRFSARSRVGGQVVQGAGLIKIKCST